MKWHCAFWLLWPLILLGSFSCTKSFDPNDGRFHFYVRTRIKSLDPISASEVYSHRAVAQIYESLLGYHYLKRPYELVPVLAESLPEISKDGLTYTFKIKKGVFFHEDECFGAQKTRELEADDFIYSWKRLADPSNRSDNYWLIKGYIKGLDEWRAGRQKKSIDYSAPVEGLQALDKHTLKVTLKKPYPQFLYALTMPGTAATPKEAVAHYKGQFDSKPVGTGPYQLHSWLRGHRMELVKNPNYHPMFYPTEATAEDEKQGYLKDAGKRLPFLDRIVINEIPTNQPQYLLFLKGDLDVFVASKKYIPRFLEGTDLKKKHKDKGMRLELYTADDVTYINFNFEDPLFRNKKLRQAMALAYDQKTAIRLLYSGLGTAAQVPVPPSFPGYIGDQPNPYRKYDLKKAKRLLAEAGYPGGKGLPVIKYEMATMSNETRHIAEFFKEQMSKIGVRLRLNANTWPQYNEKIKTKNYQISGAAWNADYPDAQNFLQLFYGPNQAPGPNNANFNDPQYNAWYEEAQTTADGAKRLQLYGKMQEHLVEETPWIFNIHRQRVIVHHPWLKNYKQSWMIFDSMKYLRIDAKERAQLKASW